MPSQLESQPLGRSQPSRSRYHILLSAYACEPGRGSEPGVGWNTARELANFHDVWVLTSQTHKAAIAAELKQNPVPSLHVIYVDPFNWIYDWSQEGKRMQLDVHLHYYLWQIWAYFVARSLHRTVQFDLAHHVTYVKYSSPSFLSFLPIPFIWGPVGGGETAPSAFQTELTPKGKLYEACRNIVRRLGEFDPFVRLTAHRSHIAWATTEETAQRLRHLGAKQVHILSQVGLNDPELALLSSTIAPEPGECHSSLHSSNPSIHSQHSASNVKPSSPKLLSIGRLLHWKGFHLGLQAFAQANLPADTEYWIIGEGPEADNLRSLAKQLGIVNQVKFCDKLPRPQVLNLLGNSLALVHPSLHESGGLVCLEAMAAQCPVICLDLGGPAVQVTPATGFKVKAIAPNQAIADIATAMQQLSSQPQLRQQMGKAAQQLVHSQYSWRMKSEQISETYAAILANSRCS
jgi:glycosyltransferase involved in cell wall biosynthesis